MADPEYYCSYPGMAFADIRAKIIDRDANPMLAYIEMDNDARAAQVKREAAYNNRWAVPDYMADLAVQELDDVTCAELRNRHRNDRWDAERLLQRRLHELTRS